MNELQGNFCCKKLRDWLCIVTDEHKPAVKLRYDHLLTRDNVATLIWQNIKLYVGYNLNKGPGGSMS